jgi:hypothetical protein
MSLLLSINVANGKGNFIFGNKPNLVTGYLENQKLQQKM